MFTQPLTHSMTIVVAEDDPNDFFLLGRAFQRVGIDAKLIRACNGEEAKDLLKELAGKQAPPDCIVLDLKMPVLNGFELLRFLGHDDYLRKIPAVVITASNCKSDVTRAYAAGAKLYFVKENKFASLVEICGELQEWLNSNLVRRGEEIKSLAPGN